ncbi:MAG: MGMT family protein, partial [Saprospiraceae bacterium]
ETKNYQFISRQLGLQNGDRAVGHAISQNPIAFLIPCHRIIGKDGSLKNFKWGTDLKLFLLRKEGMKFETSLF